MRPYLKITNTKRAGRVAQVVEHLPSKHEAEFNAKSPPPHTHTEMINVSGGR
jgi:hypothetical protein